MGSMFKPEYVFEQNKAGQNNKPWTAMKHEDLFIYGKAQSKNHRQINLTSLDIIVIVRFSEIISLFSLDSQH